MEIDLGEKVTYRVKYSGKSYDLSDPSAKQVRTLQEGSKKQNKGDEFESFIGFVVELGLPREVADELGVTKLKKLAEKLMEELNEKK